MVSVILAVLIVDDVVDTTLATLGLTLGPFVSVVGSHNVNKKRNKTTKGVRN